MGSLLEMIIVLLGAAVLTMQGIKEDVAHKRVALLQNEGQNQASINAALGDYITNNVGSLIPPGFSQTSSTTLTAPTLAQLSAQSNTKVTYKTGPFWGGAYQISLSVVPANCSAGAGDCHIASLLYPSKPLLLAGKPDVAGAGVVASAGGSQFGYSTNQVPGTISGLNGQWTTPNPNGNVAASIVAINGFGNDANSPYYRRDGALPLTGALAGGGQDANNLRNINATGTVAAAAVSASTVSATNVNATGAIAASGALVAGTTISTGKVGWPRTACTTIGAMTGASDNSGLMLSCQNVSGVWQWMPVGGPKLWYGYYAIPNGGGVGVPSPNCPAGGTPGIVVTGQSLYVDPSAAINYPIAGTGPWTVYITDGNGNVISGNAVASTFCSY
jgi:hypothetical protein